VRTLHNTGSNESFDLGTALSADPHLDACEENLMLPDLWVVSFLVSGVRNSVAVLKQFIHWRKQDVDGWGQSVGYDALLQGASITFWFQSFCDVKCIHGGNGFATPEFYECGLAMGIDDMVEIARCAQSLLKEDEDEVLLLSKTNFCCNMRQSQVLDAITKEAWVKVATKRCVTPSQ
jgi:hypothetical protein